jgi:hypothetical protein
VFPGGKSEHYPVENVFVRDSRDAHRAGADVQALMQAMHEVVSWRN